VVVGRFSVSVTPGFANYNGEMRIGTLLVALAVVSFGSSRIEGKVRQDSPLERARNGDDTALSGLERKGDVQDLQILLHDPSYAGKFAARLALARMGDVEVLQYYACRSLTVDVSQVEDLMRQDLDYIGGGFTIEIYRRLLDSESKLHPPDRRRHGRNKEARRRRSPVQEGWFFDSEVKLGEPATAKMLIPVRGSTRMGKLQARAVKEHGAGV
jgi:hypothetical protein